MFVQVFQGRVTDPQQVRRAFDDWMERLAPGAEGWLGSTGGVTDDGTFVGVARFESADAARRNSERAQQGEWWSGVSKLFSGEATFHDCSQVELLRGGGSDRAGFVQVMQGRTPDTARYGELNARFDALPASFRPELLGCVSALHDGENGAFSVIAYFSSEEEARAGEQQEPSPEVAEAMRDADDVMQDLRYYDLREPWLYSPK